MTTLITVIKSAFVNTLPGNHAAVSAVDAARLVNSAVYS